MAPIAILFKNSDFIAVDKPVGVSVHNQEDPQNLLVRLEKQFPSQKLYPVHRLDRETSGLQVLALNDRSASLLAKEFESRTVKKIYTGILRGALKVTEGSWNKPLTDKSEGRKNPQGKSNERVPCETRFRVVQSNSYFSLCEFDLLTGRQHQIRKHSAIDGHALVGDSRYGDPKYNERMASIYKNDRMFLHSTHLEFVGIKLQSSLPQEFSILLGGLPV